MDKTVIYEAIDAYRRRTDRIRPASSLARDMGITPQALGQWTRVPAERVLDFEFHTGISRHDLRPDIYPREPAAAE